MTNPITPAATDSEIIREALTLTGCKSPEETAAALLATFCNAKTVFEADAEALAKVTTKATAAKLARIMPLLRAVIRKESEQDEQINNRHALAKFAQSLLIGKRIEEFHIIAVNAQCRIIGTRCISTGSIAETAVYTRNIVEAALTLNAHSIFITHNHPGGTCAPSTQDIESTRLIQNALKPLNIMVLDHMIIAGSSVYSMAQHGDINFR